MSAPPTNKVDDVLLIQKPRETLPQGFRYFDFTHRADHSSSFDLDLFRGLLCLGLLGKHHREHAFLETCFDLVRVDAFGHIETALERAEVTLMQIIIFLLFLFFFLPS